MGRTNVLSSALPSIVLVHGALTDASVWHGVARRLHTAGAVAHAPALPMRSLAQDAEYLRGFLDRVPGPVVLAGHSYAGAVISHPAVTASGTVAALVYVAAFQPDTGESAGELNAKFPGSLLTPDNLDVTPNPLGGNDLILRPERFGEVYAADVEPTHAAVMAACQRPIDPAALGETLPGTPSWRTLPSWALISTQDRSLPPAILRFMAERAGSQLVEVESAHAVPVARPAEVADLILTAARAIRPSR
ncbi:alpha/beta fold hydrolase [Streptantibioticus ferralitis]|uniref:Alpha/beta hydrolase n=1 Tax=Streptantibioticus ferralitis TaxID=236510 RepID=A0ABT5YWN8_9ACTN|nr:alpha/beta hydrolase [Streptantibioticus ferralitis]MDF2255849.1 alpha/beta hydrolase [Streptantibioticus ferralitis]